MDNFDSLASVPTGGLVITSALAIEIVKPLIYVRNKPKEHGTTKSIEGKIESGMKVVVVDDVMTTGTSVLNGIKQLKESGLSISSVFVIINRLEGADKSLNDIGVQVHQLTDILEITNILFQEKQDLFLPKVHVCYVQICKHHFLFLLLYKPVCQKQITVIQFLGLPSYV